MRRLPCGRSVTTNGLQMGAGVGGSSNMDVHLGACSRLGMSNLPCLLVMGASYQVGCTQGGAYRWRRGPGRTASLRLADLHLGSVLNMLQADDVHRLAVGHSSVRRRSENVPLAVPSIARPSAVILQGGDLGTSRRVVVGRKRMSSGPLLPMLDPVRPLQIRLSPGRDLRLPVRPKQRIAVLRIQCALHTHPARVLVNKDTPLWHDVKLKSKNELGSRVEPARFPPVSRPSRHPLRSACPM